MTRAFLGRLSDRLTEKVLLQVLQFSLTVQTAVYIEKKKTKTPQQQLAPIAYTINREARSTKPHVQGRSGCRDRGPQRVVSGFVTGDFGESWIVAGTLSAMMRAKRCR
jgi:hypothetical protein